MIYSTRASTETLEDTIRFLLCEQEDRGIKKETCSLKICQKYFFDVFFHCGAPISSKFIPAVRLLEHQRLVSSNFTD